MSGKTSTSTSQVTVPPEVLAQYQAVNAGAQSVAQTPFQTYGGQFVAPVNDQQTAGIGAINQYAQSAQPYFGQATDQLNSAQLAAQQYYADATGGLNQAGQTGSQLGGLSLASILGANQSAAGYQGAAENAYTGAYGSAQPYNAGALESFLGGYGQAQGLQGLAASGITNSVGLGNALGGQSLNTLGNAYGAANPIEYGALGTVGNSYAAAQPYNALAGSAYGASLGAAQPLQNAAAQGLSAAQAGASPYNSAAAQYAQSGAGAVNANPLTSQQINQYLSPYLNTVLGSTSALINQNNQQQQGGQLGNAIQQGAFGGDRAGIAAANLEQQQNLAAGNIYSGILNTGYNDALSTAQQQQGVNLGAAQANRAALQTASGQLQGIGQQIYGQGTNTAQAQAALGQQQYGQVMGLGSAIQGLGQQEFGQGQTAATNAAGIGQNIFGQGLSVAQQQQLTGQQLAGLGLAGAGQQAALGQQEFGQGQALGTNLQGLGQTLYGQGMGLGTAQQGLGQQVFGQGATTAAQQAALSQQLYGQGLASAQQQTALGQDIYGTGAATSAALANLGQGQQAAGLAGGQALLGAGQVQQQTQQAADTAAYNQFLQQQSYPFQVQQFLANIAEGTGALSGSTTTTTQPQSIFSDERLKEDIEPVGKTFDGQNIVRYRYKGEDGPMRIGLLAQDVEKHHPKAVGLAAGYKTVDYGKATEGAAERGHFRAGGLARAGYDDGGNVSGLVTQPDPALANVDVSGMLNAPAANRSIDPGFEMKSNPAVTAQYNRSLGLPANAAMVDPGFEMKSNPAPDAAMRRALGLPENAVIVPDRGFAGRGHFATGGPINYQTLPPGVSPYDIAAILNAQSQMYAPFSQTGGFYGGQAGQSPRGGSSYVPQASLPVAHMMIAQPPRQEPSMLSQGTQAANTINSLYHQGSSALNTVQGWMGHGAPETSSGSRFSPSYDDLLPANDTGDTSGLYARGGRTRARYAGGGGLAAADQYDLPYDQSGTGLNIPDTQPQGLKLATANTPSSSGSSGLGDIAQLAALAAKFIPARKGGRIGRADGGEADPADSYVDNMIRHIIAGDQGGSQDQADQGQTEDAPPGASPANNVSGLAGIGATVGATPPQGGLASAATSAVTPAASAASHPAGLAGAALAGAVGGISSGTGVAPKLINMFKGLGANATQALAATSIIQAESGLNPAAFNPAGGGHGAQGLAQWRGDRIKNFIAREGVDPLHATPDQQIDFLQHELTTSYQPALQALLAAKTFPQAQQAYSWNFEAGKDPRALPGVASDIRRGTTWAEHQASGQQNMARGGRLGRDTGGDTPYDPNDPNNFLPQTPQHDPDTMLPQAMQHEPAVGLAAAGASGPMTNPLQNGGDGAVAPPVTQQAIPDLPSASTSPEGAKQGQKGPDKSFLQRLEDPNVFIPILSGLAAAASTPTVHPLMAIAEGLGAGAQSYQGMRQFGLQQQQLGQRQQEIGLASQGMQNQTAQTATGRFEAETARIAAQNPLLAQLMTSLQTRYRASGTLNANGSPTGYIDQLTGATLTPEQYGQIQQQTLQAAISRAGTSPSGVASVLPDVLNPANGPSNANGNVSPVPPGGGPGNAPGGVGINPPANGTTAPAPAGPRPVVPPVQRPTSPGRAPATPKDLATAVSSGRYASPEIPLPQVDESQIADPTQRPSYLAAQAAAARASGNAASAQNYQSEADAVRSGATKPADINGQPYLGYVNLNNAQIARTQQNADFTAAVGTTNNAATDFSLNQYPALHNLMTNLIHAYQDPNLGRASGELADIYGSMASIPLLQGLVTPEMSRDLNSQDLATKGTAGLTLIQSAMNRLAQNAPAAIVGETSVSVPGADKGAAARYEYLAQNAAVINRISDYYTDWNKYNSTILNVPKFTQEWAATHPITGYLQTVYDHLQPFGGMTSQEVAQIPRGAPQHVPWTKGPNGQMTPVTRGLRSGVPIYLPDGTVGYAP